MEKRTMVETKEKIRKEERNKRNKRKFWKMKEQANEQTNDNSIFIERIIKRNERTNYRWNRWINKQINDHRISIQVKTSMLSSSHNLDVYLSPSLSPRIFFLKNKYNKNKDKWYFFLYYSLRRRSVCMKVSHWLESLRVYNSILMQHKRQLWWVKWILYLCFFIRLLNGSFV